MLHFQGIWPRLLPASLLFLIGSLALFRPPTYTLWKLSVVVREAGHWLVGPCLLLAFEAAGHGRWDRLSALLFLGAAACFGSTVARAYHASARLAREFRAAWGEVVPGPAGFRRRKPLSFPDLFRGLRLPAVAPETHAYARKEGSVLELDFFRAEGARGPAPCVVLLHGGGWDGGSRGDFRPLNRFLAGQGYAVASLDYRLSPRFTYPAPIEDARAALAWLKDHAGGLGIDAGRFVLMGRSAGGQIALQAAYLGGDPAVKAVIAFYAPADMVLGYRIPCGRWILDSGRLMRDYLGADGEAGLKAAAAASPLARLGPEAPPTLLLHGRPDVIVTWHHTGRMRKKLARSGVRHFEVELPWAPHGYDFIFRGPGSQVSLYFLERFLAAVTRP